MTDNIVSDAEKIIDPLIQQSKKKKAYEIFEIAFAMNGLMFAAAGNDREKRKKALEDNTVTFVEMLEENGFTVTDKRALQAALALAVMMTLTANSPEDMDRRLNKVFDGMIWNACIKEVAK